MSYKCAILGHNYGEAEVEREREEDGNEVVITVRETETCTRCDDTRVVSENKEVTTLETAADIVADDLGDGGEPDQPSGSEPADVAGSTGEASAAATGQKPEIPEAESTVPDEVTDPEMDDGVILEDSDDGDDEAADESDTSESETPGASDDTESEGRAPGEWPEEEETAESTTAGSTAEWPEDDDRDGDTAAWELPTDIDPHPETEHTIERTAGDALTVPEGEFHCPECEFTTAVESSSLRAGDFCPECHKGALEHQRD